EANKTTNDDDDKLLSDKSQECNRLHEKLAEMAEVLLARENQILNLSKQKMALEEDNTIVRNQLQQSEAAREAELEDLNTVSEEFTDRLSNMERKLQLTQKERDTLKREIQIAQQQLVAKSQDDELTLLLAEKDEQIQGLMEEGEKLSKLQLQNSNIIKKLRVKEKESDNLIKSLKKQLDTAETELDHLREVLDGKEDIDKQQKDSIAKLNAAVEKQEKQINSFNSEMEDTREKIRSTQSALDASYKEIAELHKTIAAKESNLQEAQLSAQMGAKEEIRLALERAQQESRYEQESLAMQVNDLRMSLTRAEQQYARKEDNLRQEILDLQERLQEIFVGAGELDLSVSTGELGLNVSTGELDHSVSTDELDLCQDKQVDISVSTGELGLGVSTGELGLSVSTGELDLSVSTGELGLSVSTGELGLSVSIGELDHSVSIGELDHSVSTGELDLSVSTGELDLSVSTGELDHSVSTGELDLSVSAATKPLLRQIENLQSTFSTQSNSWERVERSLTERLNEAQTQLVLAQEKERMVMENSMEMNSRLASLESQTTMLRQEKSRFTALLEMERAKVEGLEDHKNKETAQLDSVRHTYSKAIEDLQRDKELLEKQLDMERLRVETEKKKLILAHDALKEKEKKLEEITLHNLKSRSTTPEISRNNSFTNETLTLSAASTPIVPSTPTTQGELLEYSMMSSSMTGSMYESVASGSATTIIESLQSQLNRKDGVISQLQVEISQLERTRASMAEELVNLSNRNEILEDDVGQIPYLKEQIEVLDRKHNAVLQMYGEKLEESQELRLDLQDVKEMYRQQIQELLKAQ
ncbi:TATA element modulatory factor-like, partial [Saccoglossus kowalevskii]